jgi:hypothetical protein
MKGNVRSWHITEETLWSTHDAVSGPSLYLRFVTLLTQSQPPPAENRQNKPFRCLRFDSRRREWIKGLSSHEPKGFSCVPIWERRYCL